VPAIFALPAYRRGAFANIALREPFGLTLIEAAVNGAPIIATTNGAGPEIVEKLQNGIVVDPSNKRAIIEAALTITTDAEKWQMFHENSLKKSHIYSWDGHVQQYSAFVGQLALESGMPPSPMLYPMTTDAKTRLDGDKVLLITDIDNTLLHGTEEGVAAFRRFVTLFRRNRDRLKLALATGRSVNSAVDYISSFDSKLISECEFLITSVGCEIHYWKDLSKTVKKGEKERTIKARVLCSDLDYHKHLSYRFSRNEIQSFIGANFPELEIQSEKTGHSGLEQRAYKLSYCVTKETGGFTDDELGFSPPATYDLSDGDDPSSPDLSSPEGGSAADIDEESSAESLLRAPSMVDLSRIGSADSLYSMGRVGSTYGLHKLGLHSVHSSASLANLAAVSSYSSLSTSIRGGLGTGETKQYQKYLKENGALNKHLHGTNLERNLKAMLRKQGFVCEVIVSHDRFVDILPIRASKGKAIRYLITRHRWPFERVAVSGDSGNDADMLSGLTRAIIVGNYATELSTLSMGKKVYFAKNCYADGIVEGLRQYFPTIV
jgi:hydroxymethylpyrimidine pyrophosphatase-like HAD family hydrolase